jgi:succinoglycan biosynthesis transport protein ExoP
MSGAELNLHLYLRIARKGAWIIVALVLLGGAAGAASAFLTRPTYQVQASVYLTVSGATTAGDLQAGNVYVMQKAATYASLATTDSVLERATERLTDGTDLADLKSTISATARDQSGIIDVFGSGTSPRQVAARTNAVAAALVSEIASPTEQPASGGTGGANSSRSLAVSASIAQPAEVPTVAVAPQPRYNVFAGVVVGLALAIALLILRYALDTRIYTLTDLPADRSLVTRTSIPPRSGRLSRGATKEVQLESFRALRANLQFGTDIGRSIAVAPVGQEGDATWVADELAKVFAEIGLKVLLVDLDLRPRPTTGKAAQAAGTPRKGVAQLLTRSAGLDEVTTTKQTESGVLYSIGAGPTTDRSSQLLSTAAMRETLTEFERAYSCVILLCPPLVERADATVVAALASSTLVVVRGGATKRAPLRFALGLLSGVRARSVSVVLENAQVS